jgi:Holliday junction resolvase RusA-like endonuclease
MAEVSAFTLVIAGQPEGKGRPKFGQGRVWTPKRTVLAETEVVRKWEEAGSPRLPDNVGLRADVTLYVVRPEGHFRKDRSLSSQGNRFSRPYATKPDLDNSIKLIFDALNKKAYRDDVRIVEVHIDRQWADWASTSIRLAVVGEA